MRGRGCGPTDLAMMMAPRRARRRRGMAPTAVVMVGRRRGRGRGGVVVMDPSLRGQADYDERHPGDGEGQQAAGARVPEGGDHACFPTFRL
jgi:hypothetical protein